MVKLKRIYESKLFMESDKDKEDLKKYLGNDLYNDYMKIRDRIPKDQNDYKDFQKLKKLPIEDVKDFVGSFQSETDKRKEAKKGAKKIYSDSDWDIYKITTYPAAQLYGSGTKWCITGRYPNHEDMGESYFNDYIKDNHLDGGYYFCLDKHNPNRKYCILRSNKGTIHSIWIPEDSEIRDVDPDDVPNDLPDDVPYNGFNLGEEIHEYIDEKSSLNYFEYPVENLENELKERIENMSINKVEELIEYLSDSGIEDFDSFYEAILRGHGSMDSKIEVFDMLLKEKIPSEDWIGDHTLEEKCFEHLLKRILEDPTICDASYFDQVFYDMITSYGLDRKKYSCVQDIQTLLSVLDNCSDDVINSNIDDTIIPSIVSALDKKILLNKTFIQKLFEHGLDVGGFIEQLKHIPESHKDLCMPILKLGVETDFVDLNDTGYDEDETVFEIALSHFRPSVEDIKWLVSHGGDLYRKDKAGKTIIDYIPKIKEWLNIK